MAHQQLHPIQIDPRTEEPFIRLPSPYENIILTPPRMEDAPHIIQNLNDPKLIQWLEGPPHPYTAEHAEFWLQTITKSSKSIFEELKEANEKDPNGSLAIVGGFPLRSIREVKEDGTQTFLGDISVDRCGFPGELDPEERSRLTEENANRKVGDPNIVWCIGDYLASSHHGRGIMSAVIGTVIREWVVPRMNAHLIRVEAYTGNTGSIRVFEKNEFVLEKTVEFEKPKILNSGTPQYGYCVLWWRRP
ncbi:hypothetical protein C8Q75DRAFT_725113 [Abortiporus biennis]|nr:hypothetical protein C8Q75DRAFT_725113 [Abortiporus biennis]